jgi:hypothetical protein
VDIKATARLIETGADAEVATIMTHANGAVSTSMSSSRAAGPNRASVIGTEGRIEIDRFFWSPSVLRVFAPDGSLLEEFDGALDADGPRGMHLEALAAERLVRDGILAGDVLPIAESVGIMGTLDEIRRQIGVVYPSES